MKVPNRTMLKRLIVGVAAGLALTGASLLIVRGGAYHPPTPEQPACPPPVPHGGRCMVINQGGPGYFDPEEKGYPWAVVTIDRSMGDFEQETVHPWGAAADVAAYSALVLALLSLKGRVLRPSRKGGAKP